MDILKIGNILESLNKTDNKYLITVCFNDVKLFNAFKNIRISLYRNNKELFYIDYSYNKTDISVEDAKEKAEEIFIKRIFNDILNGKLSI